MSKKETKDTNKKEVVQAVEQQQEAQQPQGPFVHQLKFYLVGGQEFEINEVTETPEVPRNVVAFINAWREKKDVWHSPNNDIRFGVMVKDVSMYEYRVGVPQPAPVAEEAPKA